MHKQQFIFSIFATLLSLWFYACSNSESVDYTGWDNSVATWNLEENTYSPSSKIDNLPINDTEYPYTGIPRIVIKTENHQEIKDRETEISAKLQFFGETHAGSNVMDLTIRGRGNTTWLYPKKPYLIKFNNKQSILNMPQAKKWILLANYRDRTLLRNALALEIARQSKIGWTPQGRFAEVSLNDRYIGNYFICEKIEIKPERLNIQKQSFLLEFDNNDDNRPRFFTKLKHFPVNIKSPENPSQEQIKSIQSYVDSIESVLYGAEKSSAIEDLIDLRTFALYWIINEITTNTEPSVPRSVYMYKEPNGILKAGPAWDFDWGTFDSKHDTLIIANKFWFDALQKNKLFKKIVKEEWNKNKERFFSLTAYIDSLSVYTKESNIRNNTKWPVHIGEALIGDEELDFFPAIDMLKKNYITRLMLLDNLYNQ